MEDGALTHLWVVGKDITEEKRAIEALRKSEAIFRLTFQNAPIGMALCKMDGSFVQANPAYCNMMSYTESELRKLKFQDITHPDDLVAQMPYYQKCLQGKIESYQIDKRYITKDKETTTIELRISATFKIFIFVTITLISMK